MATSRWVELYLPISKEPVPAIVIAHGSGKNYAVEAASSLPSWQMESPSEFLRDKRSSGKSTGTWRAVYRLRGRLGVRGRSG